MPRAEDGRSEPLAILRAAGAIVVDVVAYRTVATAPDEPELVRGAELLATGDAAICAVFAPSQVHALGAVLSARGLALAAVATQWCAIGDTTAAALAAAGVSRVEIARAPTPEGMAHAVRAVYPQER